MFRITFSLYVLAALVVTTSLVVQQSHALNFGGIQNAVKKNVDPAFIDAAAKGLKNMEVPSGSLGEVLKLLKDPAMVTTTKKALEALQGGTVLKVVMDHQSYFLDQMEKTGLIPKSTLDQYKKDNNKLTRDINNAQGVVRNLFSDPKAYSKLMEGMKDPKKLLGMILSGDDTAKDYQKMLSSVLESPILKTICTSPQMKSLLSNPSKWVEMAQKFAADGEL